MAQRHHPLGGGLRIKQQAKVVRLFLVVVGLVVVWLAAAASARRWLANHQAAVIAPSELRAWLAPLQLQRGPACAVLKLLSSDEWGATSVRDLEGMRDDEHDALVGLVPKLKKKRFRVMLASAAEDSTAGSGGGYSSGGDGGGGGLHSWKVHAEEKKRSRSWGQPQPQCSPPLPMGTGPPSGPPPPSLSQLRRLFLPRFLLPLFFLEEPWPPQALVEWLEPLGLSAGRAEPWPPQALVEWLEPLGLSAGRAEAVLQALCGERELGATAEQDLESLDDGDVEKLVSLVPKLKRKRLKDMLFAAIYTKGVLLFVRESCPSGACPRAWGTYRGFLLDGEPHGAGTWTSLGGEQYVGEFKQGARQGHGRVLLASGGKYTGEWHRGMRHGQGTERSPDGAVVFSGCWKWGSPSRIS